LRAAYPVTAPDPAGLWVQGGSLATTPPPIDLRDTTDDDATITEQLIDLKVVAEFVVDWQIEEPEVTTP
jgi:hypothetical protein